MRGIYKIRYAIWLVAGLSLFISGCPFKSGVEGKAWFRCASKFDQARSDLANGFAGENSARRAWDRMEKMRNFFLEAKQPTEEEIISVLKSPNRRFQRVGLAAMSAKPIETEQIVDILFEFLQDDDRDFRYYAAYSLRNFTNIPESKKVSLGKQLLEIIKKEKDKGLSIMEFSLFAEFPSEEAGRFLAEQMVKEGEENLLYRHFAFNVLKEMGDLYYDEAKEYVNAHGSSEIKDEVLKNEKAWEDMHSEENEKSINKCFPGTK